MNVTTTINAGQMLEFYEPGDFFRIMDADALIDVVYYANGKELARAEGVGEGYAERFGAAFDRLVITSETTQAIQVVARLGNTVNYDKAPTGQVQLTGEQGAFVQATKTVTNVISQLQGPKANRRYLLIQNKDPVGIIYMKLDGGGVTVASGIALGPGESYEMSGFCTTSQILVIGSIASNPNVIVVEG